MNAEGIFWRSFELTTSSFAALGQVIIWFSGHPHINMESIFCKSPGPDLWILLSFFFFLLLSLLGFSDLKCKLFTQVKRYQFLLWQIVLTVIFSLSVYRRIKRISQDISHRGPSMNLSGFRHVWSCQTNWWNRLFWAL